MMNMVEDNYSSEEELKEIHENEKQRNRSGRRGSKDIKSKNRDSNHRNHKNVQGQQSKSAVQGEDAEGRDENAKQNLASSPISFVGSSVRKLDIRPLSSGIGNNKVTHANNSSAASVTVAGKHTCKVI